MSICWEAPLRASVPVNASDHILDPDHPLLTIVEYGDFECPTCQQAAPAVKLIPKRHENQVRFVFRHFPLEEVHPHALLAAEATEAAGAQGRFWAMHDLLFSHSGELQSSQLRARTAPRRSSSTASSLMCPLACGHWPNA